MKTFKNLAAFEKRVRKTTAWDDYFKLNGRMYNIYEYGDVLNGEYVYFVNKRTHDAIEVYYRLPRINYKDGVRVEEGRYEFHSLDFIPNMSLWRPIVS